MKWVIYVLILLTLLNQISDVWAHDSSLHGMFFRPFVDDYTAWEDFLENKNKYKQLILESYSDELSNISGERKLEIIWKIEFFIYQYESGNDIRRLLLLHALKELILE